MANKKNMNKDYTVTGSLDGYGAVPPDYSNISSGYGADTITIDLGGGAAQPIYTIDTMNDITLDSSTFTLGSTTIPYTYTTIGTTGYNFNTTSPSVNITSGGIDMAAGTDIKVDGKSLKEFMNKMEERLAILVPDPKKLEQFAALKKAYEHYKLMESLCQEQPKEEA